MLFVIFILLFYSFGFAVDSKTETVKKKDENHKQHEGLHAGYRAHRSILKPHPHNVNQQSRVPPSVIEKDQIEGFSR